MESTVQLESKQLSASGSLSMGESDAVEEGILLYYKFARIDDPEETKNWLFNLCSSLGLLGRIRVAPDGINITVGGKMAALQEHIKAVSSNAMFDGTDFKLASCSPPGDCKAAAECGFTSLSARTVKELVTLGLHPSVQPPSVLDAGRHASAQEFHGILEDSVRDQDPLKKIVVVDARNVYETRIGKFTAPKGVEVLDPLVRQYSDLPRWIDENEDQLRNKQVLMYCTGGVRCEMASAYIRSKGEEFQDVVQLSGGIQRYMEAFPDGGFFVGKNFVFDHRLAVPSSNLLVVGKCLHCSTPYDDYSARCRCSLCRMLVLVCTDCQSRGAPTICEICVKSDKSSRKPGRTEDAVRDGKCTDDSEIKVALSDRKDDIQQQRKLRILCLHGFRQNASKLKGRLNALRKKLRQRVELVYIDAPHEVPSTSEHLESQHQLSCHEMEEEECLSRRSPKPPSEVTTRASKKFAWLISPNTTLCDSSTLGEESEENHDETFLEGRPNSGAVNLSPREKGLTCGSNELPSWSASSRGAEETSLAQHQTQTSGWSESWEKLQAVFAKEGPFDGVLGFSQGAAIAATLGLLSVSSEQSQATVKFRFVILCSGFISPAAEHFGTFSSLKDGEIDVPSLHIFGGREGTDRQVSVSESEQLASLFRAEKRVTVRHQSGHIIPTQPEFVQQYLAFLEQFD
ncbi:hypothetical protein R1sor_024479 [Riccia sorocarpa]|uniref:Rhodanese domain-containing protein n=1 Tax=Riccia sorocarpa TaxID=122646 RepID=A0ABD3GQT4_9MARC